MYPFQIRYIDFGNEESLAFDELTRCCLYDKTPAQMMTFSLDKIRPINGTAWDTVAIEFVSELILGIVCTFSVHDQNANNTTAPISATICTNQLEMDIASLLVANNFAENIPSYSSRERELSRAGEIARRTPNPERLPRMMVDSSNIHLNSEFSAFCLENVSVVTPIPPLIRHAFANDDDDRGNLTLNRFDPPTSSTAFKTSKTNEVSKLLDKITKHFIYQPITEKKFMCSVMKVVDALTVLIEPEYVDRVKIPENAIKLPFSNNRWPIGSPVVAFDEDKRLWKRGIIHEYFGRSETFVLFVDTFKIRAIKRSLIQNCPQFYLHMPLNYALVRLYGVAPDERTPPANIKQNLENCIASYEKVYAYVKAGECDRPAIKLMTDPHTKQLVYADMIAMKMYKQSSGRK